jgi:hypothetical protein
MENSLKAIAVVAMLLAVFVLASCQSLPPPSDPRTIWCATNEPRRDYHEGMSRAEVDKLNRHNRIGTNWCGWRPE